MARILQTDNYGMAGESPGRNESFLLWSMNIKIAQMIADALNIDSEEDGPIYYKVVDDDYEPLVFKP